MTTTVESSLYDEIRTRISAAGTEPRNPRQRDDAQRRATANGRYLTRPRNPRVIPLYQSVRRHSHELDSAERVRWPRMARPRHLRIILCRRSPEAFSRETFRPADGRIARSREFGRARRSDWFPIHAATNPRPPLTLPSGPGDRMLRPFSAPGALTSR